jgi:uncharacterized protein YuzE
VGNNAFLDRGFKPRKSATALKPILYIFIFSGKQSTESLEISEGIVADYDESGNLVGIDIDNASRKLQLEDLTLNKLPANILKVAS